MPLAFTAWRNPALVRSIGQQWSSIRTRVRWERDSTPGHSTRDTQRVPVSSRASRHSSQEIAGCARVAAAAGQGQQVQVDKIGSITGAVVRRGRVT